MNPINIIGGGLAGLTLGIGLRHQDIPVVIWEAGRYPRHRVCGEFISGRGLRTLDGLGLLDEMISLGAIRARTALFFFGHNRSVVQNLPEPALCISRYVLDHFLADHFRKLGGDLRESQKRELSGGEGEVIAAGRRRSGGSRTGWFGLKVHARNVRLESDLEMHVLRDGYVGICGLTGGMVNVCGLFRKRPIPSKEQVGRLELLQGPIDSLLRTRLGRANFDEASFCSVAGFGFDRLPAVHCPEVRIGDALSMIPPVTGNGMSMALESAELALAPLVAFSRGQLPWPEARLRVASSCDREFLGRLARANLLQRVTLLPGGSWWKRVALNSNPLWRGMFWATRGHPAVASAS